MTMKKQILEEKTQKHSQRKLWQKIFFLACILVLGIFLSGLLLNTYLRWNKNGEFEQYSKTVTMKEENFDNEIATLGKYLDELSLSDENKGKASNMISVIYYLKNQIHESILYMCKAIYYYEKQDENKAIVQMSVNLSSMLISTTSYDMAETILTRALDLKLSEKEETESHILIYTNLAKCMAQRGNYDQAIEAVQLAESKLKLVDNGKFKDSIESLKLSKALSYEGLGEIDKCKKVLRDIDEKSLNTNVMATIEFAIPYYEVQSYVKLSEKDIAGAKSYFNRYVEYCDKYSYSQMKLAYIDNFTESAVHNGFKNVAFIQKYKDNLLDFYRDELERSNQESAKILLDTYNTTVENVTIHSREKSYRFKVYGGSAFSFTAFVLVTMALIQIRKKSQMDYLTGAYNRMKLRSVYRALQRKKQSFYVIMFDIDDFKLCNDQYGHRFGDRVLEKIAETVSDRQPKTSLFFRYGGEEFILLCDLKTHDEAEMLAEEIRAAVEALTWKHNITITISIGVSASQTSKDPVKAADKCLYQSKRTGKNKITCSWE